MVKCFKFDSISTAFPASVSPLKLMLTSQSVPAGHTILHSISGKPQSFSQEAAFKNYGGRKELFKRKSDFLPTASHPSPEQKQKSWCLEKGYRSSIFSLIPDPQEQPKDYKTASTTVMPPSCNSQDAERGGRETFPFRRENQLLSCTTGSKYLQGREQPSKEVLQPGPCQRPPAHLAAAKTLNSCHLAPKQHLFYPTPHQKVQD